MSRRLAIYPHLPVVASRSLVILYLFATPPLAPQQSAEKGILVAHFAGELTNGSLKRTEGTLLSETMLDI